METLWLIHSRYVYESDYKQWLLKHSTQERSRNLTLHQRLLLANSGNSADADNHRQFKQSLL